MTVVDGTTGPTGLRETQVFQSDGYGGEMVDTLVRHDHVVGVDRLGSRIPRERGGADVEQHLLLVDLDHSCRLLVDGDGSTWLHVDVPVRDRAARRLRRRLGDAGISPAGVDRPDGPVHEPRRATAVAETLIELRDGFDGDYAQLFAVARAACSDLPPAGPVAASPGGGVWVPLVGDHLLVASRTPGHSHLIGTTPITSQQLWRCLEAFKRAGLVEPGWYRLCRRRRYACLRVPARHDRPEN